MPMLQYTTTTASGSLMGSLAKVFLLKFCGKLRKFSKNRFTASGHSCQNSAESSRKFCRSFQTNFCNDPFPSDRILSELLTLEPPKPLCHSWVAWSAVAGKQDRNSCLSHWSQHHQEDSNEVATHGPPKTIVGWPFGLNGPSSGVQVRFSQNSHPKKYSISAFLCFKCSSQKVLRPLHHYPVPASKTISPLNVMKKGRWSWVFHTKSACVSTLGVARSCFLITHAMRVRILPAPEQGEETVCARSDPVQSWIMQQRAIRWVGRCMSQETAPAARFLRAEVWHPYISWHSSGTKSSLKRKFSLGWHLCRTKLPRKISFLKQKVKRNVNLRIRKCPEISPETF